MANVMMKKQSSLYLWSYEEFSCAVFVMLGFRFSSDSHSCSLAPVRGRLE